MSVWTCVHEHSSVKQTGSRFMVSEGVQSRAVAAMCQCETVHTGVAVAAAEEQL